MIVSPPFLPARGAGVTEDQWIDSAMSQAASASGELVGFFPVTQSLNWHGGLHLQAPPDPSGGRLPVRAISDGTVVFVRQPTTPANNIPTDPLNYKPAGLGSSWTDDGCVVIRHETEIGGTPEFEFTPATRTSFTYFSIYMHLSNLTITTSASGANTGQLNPPFPIYRKDKIGEAGSIYGQAGLIHFEIIFDEDAIRNILGRELNQQPISAAGNPPLHTLDLSTQVDGRLDTVFGEIYFHLPVGTVFYTNQPSANEIAPGQPANPLAFTLTEERIVGMRFASGEDPDVSHRGDVSYRTYKLDGTEEGAAVVQSEEEYILFSAANAICGAYPVAGQPAPSAVFELLRFGRIVNMANESLNPSDVPLWKQVNYPGGRGWVNLHASGIRVYSDADLPQWKGWQVVDSDPNADSRCDAPEIRKVLDQNSDGTVTQAEAKARIADQTVRDKLSKWICKFPSEWDDTGFDTRWGWLKQSSPENTTPLDDAKYQTFKAHVQKLCFWTQANTGLSSTHWHVNPREFIRHFRKCGWLSQAEFAQCIPRRNLNLSGTNWIPQFIGSWNTAFARAGTWSTVINFSARKYQISGTSQRWLHFLAQLTEESGFYQAVKEGGGERKSYAPYFGRGLIQLTHLGNYQKYGDYRGFRSSSPSPDRQFSALGWSPNDLIALSNTQFNSHNCADTAGLYWVCDQMTATGTNTLRTSDGGITTLDAIQASRATNGNVQVQNINGLGNRLQTFTYLKSIMLDLVPTGPTEAITFNWRRNSALEPLVDAHGSPIMQQNHDGTRTQKRGFIVGTHTINVALEHQRP
jgi:hydroxyethylthiazole kinase